MTSVDPLIGIPLQKVADGKAQVDFSRADRFMDLAKAVIRSADERGGEARLPSGQVIFTPKT